MSTILDCSFGKQPCNQNENGSYLDFHWYYSYDYGSCWQFNSGLNYSNQPIPLATTVLGGVDYGLSLTISGLLPQNVGPTSWDTGLVVFISNHSYDPMSSDEVYFEPGKHTKIAVKKTFTYNQPSPYSECQDLSLFKSDLYTAIINLNHTYTQSYCYNLCLQKFKIETCGCYFMKYPMITKSRPCTNLTDLNCALIDAPNNYLGAIREECENDCPLECDDIQYEMSLSSLSYPSQQWISIYQSIYNTSSSLLREDILALDIYLENPEYTKIAQSPKLTPYDLLAQIGGSLGMFLSFSIFTFIEIGELLFLTLYALLWKNK